MNSSRITYTAPGKIILFGEHAVVYGYPALAMAIDRRAKCTVSSYLSDEEDVVLSTSLFPGKKFLVSSKESFPSSLQAVLFLIKKLTDSFQSNISLQIDISSSIPSSSGLGSSAAVSVALTNSLSSFLGRNYSLEDVNKIAFEAEKIQHGQPSGIDNNISTYGGSILYQKGLMEQVTVDDFSGFWVIANSMVERNTKDIVANVQKNYRRKQEKTEEIFHSIHSIVIRGKEYIKQNKLDEIGELMNENQTLLEQLGVGHSKLTDLLLILKKNGSMGEKLTGAGGGGCVVGLFDNIKDAHSSMKNIKKKGYQAFTAKHTKIGVTIDE